MSRTFTCTLPDGRRVKVGLKKRARDRYWVARFIAPDGKRVERSTGEVKIANAPEAAVELVRQEYAPSCGGPPAGTTTWTQVIVALERHWRASGLREDTIKRYRSNLKVLAETFPETAGPADITPAHGVEFKIKRREAGIGPVTIHSNISQFRFIWKRWLIKECKLVRENPWADVEQPRLDRTRPRLVSAEQKQTFEDWLEEGYPGWRLPHLFLEVKSYLGCRINELASLRPDQLRDGRVCFTERVSKGRKPRDCRLPPDMYRELVAVSGPDHVFQAFSGQLRDVYLSQGRKRNAVHCGGFTAHRLCKWFQDRLIAFRQAHPEAPYWKLHSLRATAISEVRASVPAEKAAVFFGVSSKVMATHYEALDETAIADEVAEARQKKVGGKWGDGKPPTTPETPQPTA